MWIITRCRKKAVQKYGLFLIYQRVSSLKVNVNLDFPPQFFLFCFFFNSSLFSFSLSASWVQAADVVVHVTALNEIDSFCQSCHKFLKILPI